MSREPADDLRRLGKHISEVNRRDRPTVDVDALMNAVPERVRDDIGTSSPATPTSRWSALTLSAATVAAALFMVFGRGEAETVRFEIDGVPASIGDRVAASELERTLLFSDGSAVRTKPDSELYVRATSERGATVVVERGQIDVAVPDGDERQWQVEVGQYRLKFAAARFEVAWAPVTEQFEIELREGSVRVRGPDLPPRTLNAGETLVHPTPVAQGPEKNRSREAPATESDAAEAPSTSRTRTQPERSSWLTFEARGDYAASYAAAERLGIESLRKRLPATQLLRLGDVARFSKHDVEARSLYQAVRERFAGSDEAAQAVFNLGLTTRGIESERFFELYLEQVPSGSLAKEALGRLLEARWAAGDREGAARLGRRYLAKYPDGPLSELAERTVGPR
ncbi:MAG: FecR domain-containing protein [Myxococcota bacterium]